MTRIGNGGIVVANTPAPSVVFPSVNSGTAEITLGELTDDSQAARLGHLFEAHHARLYRLARRLTRSSEDARDLVQETFLRAARFSRSIPTGSGPGAEEAWLVTVLTNLCRDRWRQSATRRLKETAMPPSDTVTASAENAFIAQTLVWQALQHLDPRRRAAIVLYELEGIAISRIAELLGIAAVTVRWHLSRGRQELAREISKTQGGRP